MTNETARLIDPDEFATSNEPILPDRRAEVVEEIQQDGERRGRLTKLTREEFDRAVGKVTIPAVASIAHRHRV